MLLSFEHNYPCITFVCNMIITMYIEIRGKHTFVLNYLYITVVVTRIENHLVNVLILLSNSLKHALTNTNLSFSNQ